MSNNLKKILTEEIKNFLNEAFIMRDDNLRFKQRINKASFYNYSGFSNDYDIDISESDIIVNWHIAFWLNDFGVERFLVEIESVEGQYTVDMLNKQTDELEQQQQKNIGDTKWKFSVENAIMSVGKSLYVESLDFDFKTNTCLVSFYRTDE